MFPWLRMTLLLAASGHQGHKESLHPSGWIYWLGQGHARWRQLMGEEHNWWNDTHPLQHHNCNSRKRHLSCTLKVCEHECCSCMVSKNQIKSCVRKKIYPLEFDGSRWYLMLNRVNWIEKSVPKNRSQSWWGMLGRQAGRPLHWWGMAGNRAKE